MESAVQGSYIVVKKSGEATSKLFLDKVNVKQVRTTTKCEFQDKFIETSKIRVLGYFVKTVDAKEFIEPGFGVLTTLALKGLFFDKSIRRSVLWACPRRLSSRSWSQNLQCYLLIYSCSE